MCLFKVWRSSAWPGFAKSAKRGQVMWRSSAWPGLAKKCGDPPHDQDLQKVWRSSAWPGLAKVWRSSAWPGFPKICVPKGSKYCGDPPHDRDWQKCGDPPHDRDFQGYVTPKLGQSWRSSAWPGFPRLRHTKSRSIVEILRMSLYTTPRRLDGTLNRGLVCVAHQTWTIKILTSLRKRICDLWHLANTLRSATRGHRDPHLELSFKVGTWSSIIYKKIQNKRRYEQMSLMFCRQLKISESELHSSGFNYKKDTCINSFIKTKSHSFNVKQYCCKNIFNIFFLFKRTRTPGFPENNNSLSLFSRKFRTKGHFFLNEAFF